MYECGWQIASLHNRSAEPARSLARELNVDWSQGIESIYTSEDWLWLCVPDDALANYVDNLYNQSQPGAIIHCSGTTPCFIASVPTGVAWPIHSFTNQAKPDWNKVQFAVQASDKAFAKTLLAAVSQLAGPEPALVQSDEDRMKLHLGAVMTQNFGNLLWRIAQSVLAKAELDYRLLLPLVRNHLNQLENLPPQALQSGPAIRGDRGTQQKHLKALAEYPELVELYEEMSRLIPTRLPGESQAQKD